MISYAEALVKIRESAEPISAAEQFPVLESLGRVLADDVVSRVANPPFRASAMDGFAVCSVETNQASKENPVNFEVAAVLAAGDEQQIATQGKLLGSGKAVEIMTGALVPECYDAVVRLEDVSIERDERGEARSVTLVKAVKKDADIRHEGEDFHSAQKLIDAGTVLLPHHLMLCHSAGVGELSVLRQPSVAILSTGAELSEVSADGKNELRPGMIFNSCGSFLASALPLIGASSSYYGTVGDQATQFTDIVERMMAEGADVVITTGAVSKGRYDFVPDSIRRLGAEILFHGVAVRPGKPVLVAKLVNEGKNVFFFCLPGNPVASVAGFRFFIDPYLRTLFGRGIEQAFTATLAASVKKPAGLSRFCLGTVEFRSEGSRFLPHRKQQSFMLSPVVKSTAWAVLPPGREVFEAGEEVECRFLYPSLE